MKKNLKPAPRPQETNVFAGSSDPRLLIGTTGDHASGIPALTNLRVSQEYFSREIAGKFSIGGMWGSGSSSANANSFALRYEAFLESDPQSLPPFDDGSVYERVYAVGARIDITVENADANVHFDFASISAGVQLQMASAKYSTRVFPTDSTVLRALLPAEGSLTPGDYDELIKAIGRVKDAIATTPNLTPQPYERPQKLLSGVEAELKLSQSVTFAMRCLSKRKTMTDAANDATDRSLDPNIINLVYRSRWPKVNERESPPDDVVQDAASWLVDNYVGEAYFSDGISAAFD